MGRPALSPATKEAIREAAVTYIARRKQATPKEVANALNGRFGAGQGVKLTAMRLGAILRGEKRIGRQRLKNGYETYIWRGP